MQTDENYMLRAFELAKLGEGSVLPNPMVGCVIVSAANQIVGEGWHKQYGGPHAEVHALNAAGDAARGATAYVSLEPCSHFGKTPPCANALISAGIKKVVLAMRDPNPKVNGKGIELLKNAGIEVVESVCEKEARELNVKFLTRIEKKRPWIIAKWAMTLDGKIASRTGSSSWISSEQSREIVHRLRDKMDAILVGSATARNDNPMLNVRIPGQEASRSPLRIVLDSAASISLESRLVKTAKEIPLLICVGPEADETQTESLRLAGCEVLTCGSGSENYPEKNCTNSEKYKIRILSLLENLADRGITNLLVEGGGQVLGTLFDLDIIDEVHVFIAPKLIGGSNAPTPIAGIGLCEMSQAFNLDSPITQLLGSDIYVSGKVKHVNS
ncbi:MAG: bifunctional diaminohydroxyphosphoribosylaminopyrimidine deaminase/5-amino-6-(5-phosphoribosylamino)uracil reductase RibD [Thermoguttaceae bacterium]